MSQPSASSSRQRPGWRAGLWVVLLVALVAALVVGSEVRGTPETPAKRAAALDAQLRCPSCDDVSVADSSAASAVAIRQLVLVDIEAGESESSIVSYLQSRYPGIVLRPAATGVQGLVWYAPIGAFLIAVGAVILMFRRRQKAGSGSSPTPVAEEDRRLVNDALGAV
jgi:cytochrome c-type biogenesis protein CcmH